MVGEARFGRWQLPPDWLSVSTRDGALSLATRKPPRFSFDAVRIPLFVAWDRAPSGVAIEGSGPPGSGAGRHRQPRECR